jgi:hypothetical protein
LGFISTASLNILDIKPAFLFSISAVRVLEDAGSVTLNIIRRGVVTNSASVDFATHDGTARSGVNYTAQQGTVSFGPGRTNATFTVGLINQTLAVTNVFTVTLSNPSAGSTIAAPSTETISEVGVGGLSRFLLTITPGAGGTVSVPSGFYTSNSVQTLLAIAAPGFVFAGWAGTVASTNNPLVLRMTRNFTETAAFKINQYTDGFDTGDFSALPWYFAGDAPWFIETNIVSGGTFAAESGRVGDSQSSSLLLDILTQSGTAAFDYKVSSETNWDWLEFSLNGTLLARWSGEMGWSTYEFAVPPGTNHFEWTYIKDPTITAGLDAGFIDNLYLPLTSPLTNPPPTLSLARPAPGVFRVTINGNLDRSYLLQVSTDLIHWQNLSANLFSVGGSFLDDSASLSAPIRFYRAISSP